MPAFGRPRIATRIASSPASAGPLPGRRAMIASRRSPVPCPCTAESGTGSPRPSRWNSNASASRPGSSILFAIRKIGLRECRRMAASSSSPGVIPVWVSTTKSTRSASAIAVRACSATCFVSGELSAMSTPPVSTSRKRCPDHSQTTSLRSRVTPGVSWTTAWREPVSRLTSVDLPTFGKPTTATVPRSSSARLLTAASWSRGSVLLVRLDEEAPELVDLVLDRRRGLAVALPALRQALEGHRVRPTRPRPGDGSGGASTASRGSPPGRPARLPGARPWPPPASPLPGPRFSGAFPRRTCPARVPPGRPRASPAPPRDPTRRAGPSVSRRRGSAGRGRARGGLRSSRRSRSSAGTEVPNTGGSSQ